MNDNITLVSELSSEEQKELAKDVVGEYTYGSEGAPIITKDGVKIVDPNAPRIWSPDLHAKLFSRNDLTAEYMEMFMTKSTEHRNDDLVILLPDRSESNTWRRITNFYSSSIVGSKKLYNKYKAAENHPDYTIHHEVDYFLGQVHIKVEYSPE